MIYFVYPHVDDERDIPLSIKSLLPKIYTKLSVFNGIYCEIQYEIDS